MPNNVGRIDVRKQHGKMTVTSFGQTPRGQTFIRESVTLSATDPTSKKFKDELLSAVDQLLS